MKILCIGESMYETTSPINGSLSDGVKVKLEEKYENGAGIAGNVSYLLAKWGIESYISSIIGADDLASKIKKEYETIGVKTDYIETSFDRGTSTRISLINIQNKVNTIIDVVSGAKLKKYSYSIDPDIIVSDGYELNATISAFDKYQKAKKIVLVTFYNNDIIELCRYANYIIFNMSTAEAMSGIKIDFNNSATLVDVYNKIKQKYGNSEIIITLDDKGTIYSVAGQIKIIPSAKFELVDRNGVYDTFAGAFIYSVARNFDLEKGITYAVIAASMSISKYTSRLSIPTLIDVSNYYNGKFGTQSVQNKEEAPSTTDDKEVPNDNPQNT